MKKRLLTFLTIASAFVMNAQVNLVKDIRVGTANGSPANLTVFNSKIYFSANNGTVGIEL